MEIKSRFRPERELKLTDQSVRLLAVESIYVKHNGIVQKESLWDLFYFSEGLSRFIFCPLSQRLICNLTEDRVIC